MTITKISDTKLAPKNGFYKAYLGMAYGTVATRLNLYYSKTGVVTAVFSDLQYEGNRLIERAGGYGYDKETHCLEKMLDRVGAPYERTGCVREAFVKLNKALGYAAIDIQHVIVVGEEL